MSQGAAIARRGVPAWPLYLLSGALAASPLLWAKVPPLVDYPNYLARMAILAAPEHSQNYVLHWRLIPNLSMDLVVPPLAGLVGLETAGRLFIAATLVLLLAGTAALHRALYGRVGLWPLAALLFLYNKAFYYGFLNYLFALGVAILGFALWVRLRPRPLPARVALFALVATLIFCLHLFAFGIYGVLVASFEASNLWAARPISRRAMARYAALFLQFFPALVLLVANGSGPTVAANEYGDIFDKLVALLAPMNFNSIAAYLAPLALLLAVIAWWRGALGVAPHMGWPILTLLVLAVLMPNRLYGSWAADMRLPVALPFIVIGATEPHLSRRWVAGIAVAGALGLFVLRIVAVSWSWREVDRQYDEFRTAAHGLPVGARLTVLQPAPSAARRPLGDAPPALASLDTVVYRHMAELAIIDRDLFVPVSWQLAPAAVAPRNAGLFAAEARTMTVQGLIAGLRSGAPVSAGLPAWSDLLARYDFLLVLDFGDRATAMPEILGVWAQGSFFTIYRITARRPVD